jgi:uncharacterized RDD family membrane protein YckC
MKFASAKKRVFAKLIDLAVIIFLGLAWKGGAGSVLGFLYALMADGLPFESWAGQSLGKKILRIRVIQSAPATNSMKSSVLRNLSMAVIALLMAIPFMGWLLAVMIGVPVAFVETSLMIRAEKHQRLGDVMAESYVIEL